MSESDVWIHAGNVILGLVVQMSSFTLLYGVFFLLYFQSIAAFRKRRPSRAQVWMLLISSISFILATAHEAAILTSIYDVILSIQTGSQDPFQLDPPAKPNVVWLWTRDLQIIISDGVVVWRAFVLLHGRRWLMFLPLILLLGSAASFLSFLIIQTAGISESIGRSSEYLIGTARGLSIATNTLATIFIGYVYYIHSRAMVVGLGKHRSTQAERILVLLVESGVVCGLFQILCFGAGLGLQNRPKGTLGYSTAQLIQTLYSGFTAMYPTIVIVLVNSHRSIDTMYSVDSSLQTDRLTTLQFAIPSYAPDTDMNSRDQLVKTVEKRETNFMTF
ncbi:hypothetical protein BDZ94DRAFT_1242489 [Collybia nuda]|uniref:Uncharacterized protein n=1 Tax=Collybia nuda TaxID=64659 RepID=A0A9P5YI73_9AGAR|nr:hypothetical protein BDZ94DRAFT_1242489 [Collybia nuda]